MNEFNESSLRTSGLLQPEEISAIVGGESPKAQLAQELHIRRARVAGLVDTAIATCVHDDHRPIIMGARAEHEDQTTSDMLNDLQVLIVLAQSWQPKAASEMLQEVLFSRDRVQLGDNRMAFIHEFTGPHEPSPVIFNQCKTKE